MQRRLTPTRIVALEKRRKNEALTGTDRGALHPSRFPGFPAPKEALDWSVREAQVLEAYAFHLPREEGGLWRETTSDLFGLRVPVRSPRFLEAWALRAIEAMTPGRRLDFLRERDIGRLREEATAELRGGVGIPVGAALAPREGLIPLWAEVLGHLAGGRRGKDKLLELLTGAAREETDPGAWRRDKVVLGRVLAEMGRAGLVVVQGRHVRLTRREVRIQLIQERYGLTEGSPGPDTPG